MIRYNECATQCWRWGVAINDGDTNLQKGVMNEIIVPIIPPVATISIPDPSGCWRGASGTGGVIRITTNNELVRSPVSRLPIS